jgi:hypothetical protein
MKKTNYTKDHEFEQDPNENTLVCVCGLPYGCGNHFHQKDKVIPAWESLFDKQWDGGDDGLFFTPPAGPESLKKKVKDFIRELLKNKSL